MFSALLHLPSAVPTLQHVTVQCSHAYNKNEVCSGGKRKKRKKTFFEEFCGDMHVGILMNYFEEVKSILISMVWGFKRIIYALP